MLRIRWVLLSLVRRVGVSLTIKLGIGMTKQKKGIDPIDEMVRYWANLLGLGRWELSVKIMPADLMPLGPNEVFCFGRTEINEELMSANIKILDPDSSHHVFEETLVHELVHIVILPLERMVGTDNNQIDTVTENVVELLSRAFVDAKHGVTDARIVCEWLKHKQG